MNDIQFAALSHIAGHPGISNLPDDQATIVAIAGLIDKGYVRGAVLRDHIGRTAGVRTIEVTFDGFAALEAEERRRHDRLLRTRFARRCRDGIFLAVGATFAAAASALFMRWIGPKPICERPCECRSHNQAAAQTDEPTAPLVDKDHAEKPNSKPDGK